MVSAPTAPDRVRIAALVPYQPGTTPSQRFRIEQWVPFLAEAGVDVDLLSFAGQELTELLLRPGQTLRKVVLTLAACARSAGRAAALPAGRVALVHRAAWLAGPPLLEQMLHRRGHPLLYDFDDAIFRLHTSGSNKALAWLKLPGKTATLCRISDHVVVGNNYLADWARRHNPCVTVVPTSVDTERCRPLERPPNDRLVIGWMGSSTSQTYLEAAAPILRKIVGARPVELRVVSNRRPSLSGVPHTWREWSVETETGDLAGFDIGIMPMPDDEWTRGKCAFKALQYMATGVATVASRVGANLEVIAHGRNGLLAGTTNEWLASVTSLVDNPQLRHQLGMAGRRTVEERYSMKKSAAEFERVIREVVRRREDRR